MSDIAIVRAAVYLLRASGSRTSVRKVQDLVKLASRTGRGMGTDRVIALLKDVLSEPSLIGDLNESRNDLTRDAERFEGLNYAEHQRNVSENLPERFDEASGTLSEMLRNTRGTPSIEYKKERDTEVEPPNGVSTSADIAIGEVQSPPSQPTPELGLFASSADTESPEQSLSGKKRSAKPKTPKAPKTPIAERSAEILALIWERVGTVVERSTPYVDWRNRNIGVARSLARVGRSDDDILVAHEMASTRIGAPCYSLAVLQRELIRADAAAAASDDSPAPYRPADIPESKIWRGRAAGQ